MHNSLNYKKSHFLFLIILDYSSKNWSDCYVKAGLSTVTIILLIYYN